MNLSLQLPQWSLKKAGVVVGTISALITILAQLNLLPRFGTPKWVGHWKMTIGSSSIGETQTVLRLENGQLISAYVIIAKGTGSILTTQMIGSVNSDNVYQGSWSQTSNKILQAEGTFKLIMKDKNTFQGVFSKKNHDGSSTNNLDWKGEKVD
jgi:hypothetical protein